MFTGEDSLILIIKENGVVSEQTFRVLITAGPADLQGVANAQFQQNPGDIGDYSLGQPSQTVVDLFEADVQSRGFQFIILADTLPEGAEAFGLTLATTTGEGGQFSVGTIGSTVVIIEDDDGKFIQMSVNLQYSSACEMRFAIFYMYYTRVPMKDMVLTFQLVQWWYIVYADSHPQ